MAVVNQDKLSLVLTFAQRECIVFKAKLPQCVLMVKELSGKAQPNCQIVFLANVVPGVSLVLCSLTQALLLGSQVTQNSTSVPLLLVFRLVEFL